MMPAWINISGLAIILMQLGMLYFKCPPDTDGCGEKYHGIIIGAGVILVIINYHSILYYFAVMVGVILVMIGAKLANVIHAEAGESFTILLFALAHISIVAAVIFIVCFAVSTLLKWVIDPCRHVYQLKQEHKPYAQLALSLIVIIAYLIRG